MGRVQDPLGDYKRPGCRTKKYHSALDLKPIKNFRPRWRL